MKENDVKRTAHNLVDRDRNSVKMYRHRDIRPGILCFVCGLCIILSLVCSCLGAFVVLLQRDKSSTGEHTDPYSSEASAIMTNREPPADLTFRLPQEVKPVHYDLYLHPDLEKGTFQGKVTISIDVVDKRSYIALHQKDLNITSTKLTTIDREINYDIPIKTTYNIEKLEVFVIATENDITDGLYKLSLEFDGALQPNKIVGFYSSSYKDEDGKKRLIATSKFEPTYARRGFPCFDEPGFKAEFSVKLVHPSGYSYTALSNMHVESSLNDQPSPGLTTVTFAKSVPMSTYLACFIVSDFVAVTSMAKRLKGEALPVSVYATKAQKEKGRFAVDIGVKAIEFYINLFQIDYPLPKLDMAAIPDFVSGAMENWGLVTYREARLLYSESATSTNNKKGIVTVIAHEFAHMWFGNLVTMEWWNDLWLNEGFATYMQYKCADAILPEWGFMEDFLVDNLYTVFVTDSKLSSHPIVQTVSNPDEITAIFDVISYSKGSAVLRMLNNFVGSDVFNAGITAYLKKYEYANAKTEDLFNILQDAVGSKLNVTNIMDTWTRQMGFPVVEVVKNGNSYVLKQKRFLADSELKFDPTESQFGYKWTIPITYITNKNPTPTLLWFDRNDDNLVVNTSGPVEWIKFNKDQVGYYRVNYEVSEWQKLKGVLQKCHETLTASDRTSLLEDAFSLAEAGELDYTIAMDITSYLPRENHPVPWSVAATKLIFMDKLLFSTNVSPMFREYMRRTVDVAYHKVLWTVGANDSFTTLSLRTVILNLACLAGHQNCLNEVQKMFSSWIHHSSDVRPPPDIRALVYYYGMNYVGDEFAWEIMFQRFVNEKDSNEKLKLMRGLAGIRSAWVLNRFINIAFDETYVRAQDFFGCLQVISSNPIGTPLVWDWLRENWEKLVNRYTLNDRYLGQLIPAITKTFSTELRRDEMKAFFAKYPEAGAGVSYRAQALETVSNNIKWLKRNANKVEEWLISAATHHSKIAGTKK
ncbi:glutamyl aminopeptidase [Orussus abietinus]|uniref:glutamyl aminopeptidase n=1 Tax=Orussus abietinus TaxID=222816 RepID=UPI000625E630|nr:glutamyl aminopeptidase [Orussus abietinus]XP_012276538.1 glutamyl aminopeptidase [Orussus abietinus]